MQQRLANYYKDLPQGFKEDFRIDAKKTSVVVVLSIVSFVLIAIVGVSTYLLRFGIRPLYDDEGHEIMLVIALAIIIFGYFAYLVIHELTHGICYKLFTKQKLKFGFTLYVAYCGLREGYVNKKTAVVSVLAPFVVHSVWMLPTIFLVSEPFIALAFLVLFAFHFGGCVGDLWVTITLIFKYRAKAVLMSDDGPCQIFYTYSDEPCEAVPPIAVAEKTAPPETEHTEEK